jgi:hypothetical protein
MTQLVAHALQGSATLDFSPRGVLWHLEFPGSDALAATNKDEAPK